MSRSRWEDLDAEIGVAVLMKLWTAFVVVMAVVGGLSAGSLSLLLVLGALAALSGWVTRAWDRGRPWSWWVLTVAGGVALLLHLGALLTGQAPWHQFVRVALEALFLLLLAHPRSRERIQPEYA